MVVVSYDRNGLEILDRASCLQLLGSAHVGRIALTMGALPVVFPVHPRTRQRLQRANERSTGATDEGRTRQTETQ